MQWRDFIGRIGQRTPQRHRKHRRAGERAQRRHPPPVQPQRVVSSLSIPHHPAMNAGWSSATRPIAMSATAAVSSRRLVRLARRRPDRGAAAPTERAKIGETGLPQFREPLPGRRRKRRDDSRSGAAPPRYGISTVLPVVARLSSAICAAAASASGKLWLTAIFTAPDATTSNRSRAVASRSARLAV